MVGKKRKIRLTLFHKILSLVVMVLVFASVGAIVTSIISNKRIEKEISANVNEGFNNVFESVDRIFKQFQRISEESVRKTSGLVALDEIKKIAEKGQEKFQKYTQSTVSDMGKEVSKSVQRLEGVMSNSFDAMLAVASNTVGSIIEEAERSSNVISQVAGFRVEALIQASLDGFDKVSHDLKLFHDALVESDNDTDFTTRMMSKVDSLSVKIITKLDEVTSSIKSMDADESVKSRQIRAINDTIGSLLEDIESFKQEMAEGTQKVYNNVTFMINRDIGVIKEQMRLMEGKMQADSEQEKMIASAILNHNFEMSIGKVIEVQNKARQETLAEQKKLAEKIRKLNEEIPKRLKAYGEETKNEINKRAAETVKGATKVIEEAKMSLVNAREESLKSLNEVKETSVKEVSNRIKGIGQSAIVSLNISMLVIAIIFIGISIFVVRTITHPSIVMVNMLKNMAQGKGDLTQRINITTSDEIGELAYWFNMFVDQLRNIIKGIMEIAKQVADAAEQFSATTEESNASMEQITGAIQNISRGATQQLDEVRKSESLFQNLREMLNIVVDNAKEATATTVHSAERAAEGKKAADQLIEKINRIAEAANLSTTAINELKESSKQIGDIVVTITSFADQTNLLSLNAAIEAARAGEAGRGFAVVAEEVRKLAEGSAHAANRISQLVQKIIEEIDRAVSVVMKEKQETEEGRRIVIDTGKIQEELVAIANKAKEMMVKISDLVPEQLNATEKVMGAIHSVASVAEENAAATEEVSSSVEEMTASMEEMSSGASELAKTAQKLQEGVNQFKVE